MFAILLRVHIHSAARLYVAIVITLLLPNEWHDTTQVNNLEERVAESVCHVNMIVIKPYELIRNFKNWDKIFFNM